MKRLFSFIALLSLLSGVAYAYDADGNVANRREIAGAPGSVAYREYQLVRYAENGVNGVQLSAGDVVAWDCVSDDGITVAPPGTTNSADAVAGVVVSTTIPTSDVTGTTAVIDFGRRNWGYIQTKGLCTKVNEAATNVAAGGSLVMSGTTKYAVVPTNNSGTKVLGFAMDTSTVSNTNDVYINL